MKKIHIQPVLSTFVLLLLALLTNHTAFGQSSDEQRVYIQIEIKGMACPYCAYGMEKEFKKISGIDNVEIELKEGLAYISTPVQQRPSAENLKGIVRDAGFTPGEVVFQDSPFKAKKAKE